MFASSQPSLLFRARPVPSEFGPQPNGYTIVLRSFPWEMGSNCYSIRVKTTETTAYGGEAVPDSRALQSTPTLRRRRDRYGGSLTTFCDIALRLPISFLVRTSRQDLRKSELTWHQSSFFWERVRFAAGSKCGPRATEACFLAVVDSLPLIFCTRTKALTPRPIPLPKADCRQARPNRKLELAVRFRSTEIAR